VFNYHGSCHCGDVEIVISKTSPIQNITECNCSICQKKGILHVAVQTNELNILKGSNSLTMYQFGSNVAEHKFCKKCGIHIYGRPRSAPERLTVNIRCLDNFSQIISTAKVTKFDGQNHPKDQ
jgi:hypothetical protein